MMAEWMDMTGLQSMLVVRRIALNVTMNEALSVLLCYLFPKL